MFFCVTEFATHEPASQVLHIQAPTDPHLLIRTPPAIQK